MKTMNPRLYSTALAASLVVLVPSVAGAAACKNVDINLANQSPARVKAKYAFFKCEGENERKEMFKNVEVPEVTTRTIASHQDLQGCQGRKMEYIDVHYEVLCGSGKWSKEKSIKDKSFLNAFCSSDAGKEYTVQLPANDPDATCD
jgi:hypothetical protein